MPASKHSAYSCCSASLFAAMASLLLRAGQLAAARPVLPGHAHTRPAPALPRSAPASTAANGWTLPSCGQRASRARSGPSCRRTACTTLACWSGRLSWRARLAARWRWIWRPSRSSAGGQREATHNEPLQLVSYRACGLICPSHLLSRVKRGVTALGPCARNAHQASYLHPNPLLLLLRSFRPLPCSFRANLVSLLESGTVDVCFCNEDEALELVGGSAAQRGADGTAEAGLQYLSQHVNRLAVVTLGEKVGSREGGRMGGPLWSLGARRIGTGRGLASKEGGGIYLCASCCAHTVGWLPCRAA